MPFGQPDAMSPRIGAPIKPGGGDRAVLGFCTAFLAIVVACALAGCAENTDDQIGPSAHGCINVEMDSAGWHSFARRSIAGIARSHGKYGLADYVMIEPPKSLQLAADNNIIRVTLYADVKPEPDITCGEYQDIPEPKTSCGASLGRAGLAVTVNFKPISHDRAATLTRETLDYIRGPEVAVDAPCKRMRFLGF
jgi:hypothetical protein